MNRREDTEAEVPRLRIINSRVGIDREVDAPEGGNLADLADAHRLPIPFSCRSASCATCQVRVLEGDELFDAADEDERELLEFIGAPEDCRLACQARLKPGPGVVRLEPA
jgi:ferredoxin